MIQVFILLACINTIHPACVSTEFNGKATCEAAGEEWIAMNPRTTARYRCVAKGGP